MIWPEKKLCEAREKKERNKKQKALKIKLKKIEQKQQKQELEVLVGEYLEKKPTLAPIILGLEFRCRECYSKLERIGEVGGRIGWHDGSVFTLYSCDKCSYQHVYRISEIGSGV